MSILRDLEQKYGLHPSIKGQELQDREELHKVDYQKGDVKQQVSSTVRSCLRHYRCASFGGVADAARSLQCLGRGANRNHRRTRLCRNDLRALTDDGYGIGTPFKSSRIGKDVGYEACNATTSVRKRP